LVIRVARLVTGLSARVPVTVASAVITSPGRTGARKRQTLEKDAARSGKLSATSALSRPVVTLRLHDDAAESTAPRHRVVVVDRVAVPGDLGEQLDVAA
jgi:hypothetical protein